MEWHPRAYSISDIREWSKQNILEIRPDFQRREVWSTPARIALIDTILRSIPIPKIYVQSILNDDDEKVYRIVVDGQQRLTTILMFLNDNLQLRKPYVDDKYNKCHFKDLPIDVRKRFLTYQVDFNDLVNPTDEEVRDLYARVNKYTVQLNKQELRRADFPGEFLTLAEELSDLKFFEDSKFFSAGQKRRMLDVEYISELIALLLEGEQDKKDSLDDFCERYKKFPQGLYLVKTNFENILKDIGIIFSNSKALSDTRFKQKADFYSLFACIVDLKKQYGSIITDSLPCVRESLYQLDELIAPHAEHEPYSEYAIRCISDANSISSRRWRKKFLFDYIVPLYRIDEEMEVMEE